MFVHICMFVIMVGVGKCRCGHRSDIILCLYIYTCIYIYAYDYIIHVEVNVYA